MSEYQIPEEPVDSSKSDIGGIQLPKTEDMPKWLVVVVVLGIISVFGYMIISYNQHVTDLKEQLQVSQENYNRLMERFVYQQEKSQVLEKKIEETDSIVRHETEPYTSKILKNENTH